MQDQVRFAALLEDALNRAVQEYAANKLSMNREVIQLLRVDLKKRLELIFNKCDFRLAEKSIQWLADQYFKCVNVKTNTGETINLGHAMILSDEVKLRDIPGDDLSIMTNLFGETDFGDDLFEELRRRKG
jgi:hypothetical protein